MHLLGTETRTRELDVRADHKLGVVDVTSEVERVLEEAGVVSGIVCVYCRHTTCGVVINELEDGLHEDLVSHVTSLVPGGYFAHDDLGRRTQNLQGPDEPANGPAHVRQMMFGSSSQVIPVVEGRLALGRWQRILFFELDEPRDRNLLVAVIG